MDRMNLALLSEIVRDNLNCKYLLTGLILALLLGVVGFTACAGHPKYTEVSFELSLSPHGFPYSRHSVPVYLEENEIMKVHYMMSPQHFVQQVIKIEYSSPDGSSITVRRPWTGGSDQYEPVIKTQPHGEDYYSINFVYIASTGYDLELLENIDIVVRYEILK